MRKDALQAAHVGCYGYARDTTPALDAVAKKGLLFSNVLSVASWTVPSSMTWFTGVYPSEHRMTNKYAVYSDRERKLANLNLATLADILKQNSYATGGFTGNAGVSGGFGYEQGFDAYYYPRGKFGSIEESIPRSVPVTQRCERRETRAGGYALEKTRRTGGTSWFNADRSCPPCTETIPTQNRDNDRWKVSTPTI